MPCNALIRIMIELVRQRYEAFCLIRAKIYSFDDIKIYKYFISLSDYLQEIIYFNKINVI